MSMSVESTATGATRPPLSHPHKAPSSPFSLISQGEQTSAESGASQKNKPQSALSAVTAQVLLEMLQAATPVDTSTQKSGTDTIAKTKSAYTENIAGTKNATVAHGAASGVNTGTTPTVEKANGLNVITSGHSLDAREGVSFFETIDSSDLDMDAFNAAAETANRDYTITVGSTTPADALPSGAVSIYADIDLFHTDGTRGLEWTTDPEHMRDYVNKGVDELVDIINAEKELQAKYGDDVKLIYSHQDKGYIMLTPDDGQYKNHDFASDAIAKSLARQNGRSAQSDLILQRLKEHGYA